MPTKPRAIQAPKKRSSSKPRPFRLTPNRILVAVLIAAAGLAAALIAVSLAGSGGGPKSSTAVSGAADAARLLRGIPQQGNVLGSPKAPVTLVEYGDLQCPYCGQWTRETLPTIVRDYVRPGRVKLVFRGLSFVGPDSETALRAAVAAGSQNRLWNMVDLLYANQGEENAGWVTNDLLRSLGKSVPGLDVTEMMDASSAPATTSAMNAAADAAAASGIHQTPTFVVGRTGGQMQELQVSSLDVSAFRRALDQLLSS